MVVVVAPASVYSVSQSPQVVVRAAVAVVLCCSPPRRRCCLNGAAATTGRLVRLSKIDRPGNENALVSSVPSSAGRCGRRVSVVKVVVPLAASTGTESMAIH